MSATKLNNSAQTRTFFCGRSPLPDGRGTDRGRRLLPYSRGTDRRRRIAHGLFILGLLAVLPIMAVGAGAGRSATSTYTIIDLGTLGGLTSVALGINKVGQVCGGADMADGKRHAFLWEDGVMTDLGTNPPTSQSEAWDINNAGTIVGLSSSTGDPARGFIWENGEMTTLVDPPTATTGLAINDHRQVVGIFAAPGGSHAFLWEDGVLTDLGTLAGSYSIAWDINDAGQVVGRSSTGGEPGGAFLWEDGVMSPLGALGGGTSEALAINEAGQVVGHSKPSGETFNTAVLWDGGEIVDLDTLTGVNPVSANGINNNGQILIDGYLYDLPSATGAFLNTLLLPDTGWSQLSGRALNDAGQIVGAGTINGFRHAFVMTPPPAIPAVSTWGAVLMALALLAGATIVFGWKRSGAGV